MTAPVLKPPDPAKTSTASMMSSPPQTGGSVADNRDLERNPMDMMDIEEPESVEEYVPGIAGGRHYMARLCHFPDGPWYIAVIHVESLPPLHDSDRTWPTREEAVQAADKLVADLGH